MAAWQSEFALEPDLKKLPDDYREHLDRLLPRGKTWANEQEAWGEEDANRIDVWHDPRSAAEVRCRIDLRRLDPDWLAKLCAFVQHTARHFQTPDGRVIEPNVGDLSLALRGSPAWRFVADPDAYLRRIKLGGVEDA